MYILYKSHFVVSSFILWSLCWSPFPPHAPTPKFETFISWCHQPCNATLVYRMDMVNSSLPCQAPTLQPNIKSNKHHLPIKSSKIKIYISLTPIYLLPPRQTPYFQVIKRLFSIEAASVISISLTIICQQNLS